MEVKYIVIWHNSNSPNKKSPLEYEVFEGEPEMTAQLKNMAKDCDSFFAGVNIYEVLREEEAEEPGVIKYHTRTYRGKN